MSHRALYQKYRPAHFTDLIGQAPIARTLQAALEQGKVAHAYLFTGSRGTGKTSTARLLAKGVNCLALKNGEPCGKCDLCKAAGDGSLMDILEIDAASNRGIDEIRELRDKVGFAPTQGNRKVYIIDEVHMLTKEAFNALLKTLEEPPAHAMFILATTEPHKVPQTIISRCQRFDFRPATAAVLAEHLQKIAKAEKLTLAPEAAETMATAARGSFRDALSLLDTMSGHKGGKITEAAVHETLGLADLSRVAALERALVARDQEKALAALRQAAEHGIDPTVLRLSLIGYLRHLLLARAGAPVSEEYQRLAADWDVADLARALRGFLEADEPPNGAHPELPLELAVVEFILQGEEPETSFRRPPESDDKKAAAPKVTQTAAAKPANSKPAAPAKADKPAQESPSADVWEELLRRTKAQYSLSLCLQKTRPLELTDDKLSLAVQSEFFLNKLASPEPKGTVEAVLKDITGRQMSLTLSLDDAPRDVFEDALSVFEGAQVDEVKNG